MSPVVKSAAAAVQEIASGSSIAVGGFGLSGSPGILVTALCELGLRDLEIISNNIGLDEGSPMHRLVCENRVRKFVGSFPGGQAFFERFYTGQIELELVPQGTLAERLRAGGAGIPAFYTPTAANTTLALGGMVTRYDEAGSPAAWSEPKEQRGFDGRDFVLEHALKPRFGLVKAHTADLAGNLTFNLSAANFNPLIGLAADHVIVEVEHLVATGDINPNAVGLPGIAVDVLVVDPASASAPGGSL